MGDVDRRAAVAYFLFVISARCSMVLAAAVLFSVQLRTTSLLLQLPRTYTYIYHSKFCLGNLHSI